MPNAREWAGLAGHYGAAGESAAWRVVFEHYYWDKLEEAHNAALSLGAGNMGHSLIGLRMIEGEHMTRERGSINEVNDWLKIETIQDEMPIDHGVLQAQIKKSCDAIAKRFDYEHSAPTLVSVLAQESNVPWMPGRHGYCTDKYPYEKICVPHAAVHDPDVLDHVIVHEYTHVINHNLSKGRCPLWLDEALAMVAEGGIDKNAWHRFANGQLKWLPPDQLDHAYRGNREAESERRRVWMAYQQSGAIGHYLASLRGEKALAGLMRAYANNSFFQDIFARFSDNGLTDEALYEVYRTNTENLFRDSHSWLQSL